jgi:hypothetical protein
MQYSAYITVIEFNISNIMHIIIGVSEDGIK